MSNKEETKEKEPYVPYDIDDRKYRTITVGNPAIDKHMAQFLETVMKPYIRDGSYHNVDTSGVEVGRLYTYKKLCEALKEKYDGKAGSNTVKAALRLWRCFMDVHEYRDSLPNGKLGKTYYRIEKVYRDPIPAYFLQPPRSNRQFLLAEAVFTIMRCEYALDVRENGEEDDNAEYAIGGPKDFMLEHFGFISNEMRKYLYDVDNSNKKSNRPLYRIINSSKLFTSNLLLGLESALRSTHNCYLSQKIFFSHSNEFGNKQYREATDFELEQYNTARDEKLQKMNIPNEFVAISQDKYADLKKAILEAMKKFCEVYDFYRRINIECKAPQFSIRLLDNYSNDELRNTISYCRNVVFQISKQYMVKEILKNCNEKTIRKDTGIVSPSVLEWSWIKSLDGDMPDKSIFYGYSPIIPKDKLLDFVTQTVDGICGVSLSNQELHSFVNFDSLLNEALKEQIANINKEISQIYEGLDFDSFDI